MPYRLLAIDIDGTLVNSQDELTPGVRAALREAKGAGIEIVLATGRRYSRTLHLVEPLGLEVPLVTAAGGLIKNPLDHRTLWQARFDRLALLDTLKYVAEAGYDAVLCADTFDEGFDYYCPRLAGTEALLAEYYELNAGCERILPDLMTAPPEGIFAGFTMGTKPQMLALKALLERRLPDDLSLIVLRSPRYRGYMCEIGARDVSKWSGIRHLAEAWGIADDEICAVGDDLNDLHMIQAAGLGIAMGNAVPELKAAADRIAPGNNEEGLVEVVRWVLEGV
jgi:hypothetical protein